jgi:serine/threonine-protein kinase
LEQLVAEGPPSPERAIDITRQILDGLAFAHGRGVVHRDLKPANVFLQTISEKRDHVKLLDFGLAKFLETEDDEKSTTTLTKAGTIFGTPAYMAPEQCMGSPADERADVYCVGVMLFELITGRRPFIGTSRSELMKAHVVAPVPPLASIRPGIIVAPELEAVVQRALGKEPADRYPDAAVMLTAIERIPNPPVRLGNAPAGNGKSAALSTAATMADSPAAARPSGPGTAAMTTPAVPPAVRGASRPMTRPATPIGRRPSRIAAFFRTVFVLLLALGTVAGVLYFALNHAARVRAPEDVEPAGRTDGPGGSSATEDEVRDEGTASPDEAADDPDVAGDEGADENEGLEQLPAPSVRAAARDPWRRGVPRALSVYKRRVNAGAKLGRRNRRAIMSWSREHPADVRPHLLLARAYMNLNWRGDAIERYQRAYRMDSSSRGDRTMLRDLLNIVPHGGSGRAAANAIVEIYGAEARSEVQTRIARAPAGSASRAAYERLRSRL